MFDLIRSRLREERGFTLIELLVVMIIIAILMAVAVPVFLGQKQKALATNAKTNVKNVYDAIESCGASTSNGTLFEAAPVGVAGAREVNCTDTSANGTIAANEPSLARLLSGTGCGGQPCVSITDPADVANPDSYTLVGRTATSAGEMVTFTLTRTATSLAKTCDGAAESRARMCPSGVW